MTIRRCILFVSMLWIASCFPKQKAEPLPRLAQLSFIDSVEVIEENHFFAKASQTELIGDSLIAVSSFLTPGIWFIDVKTGKIKHRIVDREILETPVFPAAFDVSKFPEVAVLHPKLRSVYIFDAVSQRFINKVELKLPEDKMIRTVESFFLWSGDYYIVELYSESGTFQEGFYSSAGHLIGFFDKEGNLLNTTLEYPEGLKNLSFPIMPYRTFAQSYGTESPLISFPVSGEIVRLNANNFSEEEYLKFPKNSQYFQFEPAELERAFNPDFQKHLEVPSSHFFFKIVQNDRYVLIQTDMRDNDRLGEYKAFSHVFAYRLSGKDWFETSEQFDQANIGLLAGAVGDTLYFFEGSMKRSEAKYIKRAVLRPVEE